MNPTIHFSEMVHGNVGTSTFDGPTSGFLSVWLERNLATDPGAGCINGDCQFWSSVGPRLVTPINVETFFDLLDGDKMHLGITSTTKAQAWQKHTIEKTR